MQRVVYRFMYVNECVRSCVQEHLPFRFTYKHALCVLHRTLHLKSAANIPRMGTVGLWQRVLNVCLVLWCRHVSVCHPRSLSQFIFVAGFFCQCTAIYCESSPPSGLSNCFGFEAGEIDSICAHTRTLTHSDTHANTLDSFGFRAEYKRPMQKGF